MSLFENARWLRQSGALREAGRLPLWVFPLLGLVLSFWLPKPSLAASDANAQLLAQRASFVLAEKAFKSGQLKVYRRLKASLADYPLLPYLEYGELVKGLDGLDDSRVRAFVDLEPGSTLSRRLRSKWLQRLAKRKDWARYLAFDYDSKYVPNRCRTGLALLHTGKRGEAFAIASELWLVGKSQPEVCDPLFEAWEKAGGITPELRWQRVRLAMVKGKSALARFVAKGLDQDDQGLVEAWVQLRAKPQALLSMRTLHRDTPHRRELAVYAMQRWARKDVDAAMAAWPSVSKRYRFSGQQRAEVLSYIALRLMRKQRLAEATDWLKSVPLESASQASLEYVVKVALVAQRWDWVLRAVDAMGEREQLKDEWRYWHARAFEAQGKAHEARKYYAGLSLSRSYYAFLAADRVGAPYTMDNEPLRLSEAVLHSVERMPAVVRAKELFALGRKTSARREWWSLTTHLDRVQLRAAAKIAQSWGWHSRAISAVARSGHFNDLVLRFPLAYREVVERHARVRDLNPAWVMAMMRQESAFAADARSRVGARGLMQLMPATAKMVARKLKRRLRSVNELENPDTNIRFGTWYLRHVLDDLGNNPILATAAYNAGPHRVKRWLPKEAGLPADIWVEAIPFSETRKYVKNILAYSVIYETRMGITPARLAERMPPIGLPVAADAPHRGGVQEEARAQQQRALRLSDEVLGNRS